MEIFDDNQETVVQQWLKDEISKTDGYRGVWLGLTDMEHDGVIYSSILNTEPNYQNWAYGEPNPSDPGTRCGHIPPSGGPWQILRCGVNCGKICMKRTGRQCPSGWTYHSGENNSGKCYQYFVNGNSYQNWYSALNYCNKIGARMLTIKSKEEQQIISKYFSSWSRGGVTRFLLGISDTLSQSKCNFQYTDGRSVYYE